MDTIQNFPVSKVVQDGLYWGAATALSAGAVAYFQNRCGIAELVQKIDSTYVVPSFKTAMILGVPAFGIELLSRSVEILTFPNVPKFQMESKKEFDSTNNRLKYFSDYKNYEADLQRVLPATRKRFLLHLMMTAAKVFVFVKGAEAIANRGFPMHRSFIYQASFIYACNSLSPQYEVSEGAMFMGALSVALTWILHKIGFEGLMHRINKDYVTPSYSQAFVWVSTSIFTSWSLGNLLKCSIENGLGPKASNTKIERIAQVIIGISIQYGFAKLLNRHGFSISDPYIAISLSLYGNVIAGILRG